jgi:hypothetical protein
MEKLRLIGNKVEVGSQPQMFGIGCFLISMHVFAKIGVLYNFVFVLAYFVMCNWLFIFSLNGIFFFFFFFLDVLLFRKYCWFLLEE